MKYSDPFTTKMHSELTVEPVTEIRHRVYSAMKVYENSNLQLKRILKIFNLTYAQYNRHKHDFI